MKTKLLTRSEGLSLFFLFFMGDRAQKIAEKIMWQTKNVANIGKIAKNFL